MAKVGDRVLYTVPEHHRTTTQTREKQELTGSVHHRELQQFAGTIGRIREEERGRGRSATLVEVADIHLLVPGAAGTWVAAEEGDKPGQFVVLVDAPPKSALEKILGSK